MGLTRRVAGLALGTIGLALILALGASSALAAPLVPFATAHPELSPARPPRAERTAEAISSRGGERAAPVPADSGGQPAAPAAQRPAKIGLQAGHWRAAEAPYPLNVQTGSSGRGKSEAEVNLPIAEAAARALRAAGHAVDVLPTVIPRGYQADLVVAIHADGGPSSRRGFFVDTSFRQATSAAEAKLAKAIADAYSPIGIPYVFRGTRDSRYYYGYYSVAATTPMVLLEAGFLSNPTDQTVLVDRPDQAGEAIARGILDYLAGEAP